MTNEEIFIIIAVSVFAGFLVGLIVAAAVNIANSYYRKSLQRGGCDD